MPVIEGTERLKIAVAEYDFALDGGAIGPIALRGIGVLGGSVPSGGVVHSGYVDVINAVTGGAGATTGLHLESAGDLIAPAIIATAGLNAAGRKNVNPSGTGSTTLKTTASRPHTLTVGVATLTAGKFRVYTFYI